MKRSAHLYMVVALGGGLLLTACSLLNANGPSPRATRPAEPAPAALHISQVGFGHDARFSRCMEPACPSVTPKALASTSVTAPLATVVAMPPAAARTAVVARPLGQLVTALPKDPGAAAPRKVTLYFGTNNARLTAAHKTLLSNALSELQRTDGILISGRTDDLGSEPLNQALALARALAIRDHLLDLAPDLPARIAIDAKGRCCYAAPNESSAGRALNRRVELVYALRDEGAP